MPASTRRGVAAVDPIEVELTPSSTAVHRRTLRRWSSIATPSTARSARLDPEWRAVVVLHYYLGMPLPDVADALGIPLGTAKSRLHRSLGVLRISIDSDDVTAPAAVATEGRFA